MAVLAAGWLTLLRPAGRYFGFRAHAATVQPEQGKHPAANAARIEQSDDRAKLIFELSAPLDATAFVLADPDRVIVDLPQTDFALDPETGKAAYPPHRKAGLIAAFRFGQLAPGKSRIVIELGAPAQVVLAACDKSDSDGHVRFVVELAKTDRRSFEAAVQTARIQLAALAQPKTAQKPEPESAKPVIMIDPGHGGIDHGAMVKGLIEKELVFDFAKAVAAKLDADGRFKVVMTRDGDSFVPLSERVRMARDGNAALFVSIHADTLSSAADVSGATVYTLSDRASDAEAARVAEKENQSDAAAGLDKTEDASDVSGILFDLTRRETRAYSHFFAHTLVNYWRVAGRLNKNPRRSAGFLVLKAPDVPSVLLELGYLSNEKDGLALASAQWRDKASSQVADAIEAFFAARESGATVTKTDPDRVPVGKIPSAGP
ncbi:MAG: N-acetylmuramoyl-L-alanine amidase [Beijerinckiaceae bacterium]|nr:MAG: N-acetylmuramoyl-L-alanine amidase [Beijerinckiaceae bacterium]